MSDWDLHYSQLTESSKPYSQILAYWTLIFSIPSVLTTLSLLIILLIWWRKKGYLSLDEQLSVFLISFDLLSSVSMQLIGVFNLIQSKIIINNEFRCKLFSLFFIFCFHNSIYSICFISIYRLRKIESNGYPLDNTKFYILMGLTFGSHLLLDILGIFFGKFSIQKAGCYCLPDPSNSFSKVIIADFFVKGTLALVITTFCYYKICYKKCQASLITIINNNDEFSNVGVKRLIMESKTNRKVVYNAIIICGFYILSYILMVVNALSELIFEESRSRELDFISYILMSANPLINTWVLLGLNTKIHDLFWNTVTFKKSKKDEPFY